MTTSIRERQAAAIKRMLNFGNPVTKASSMDPEWKVLIYDRSGQDIISPLLSVSDLREMGVTLYLLLHSDRDPVPDVPAIYFVLPTEENIARICQSNVDSVVTKVFDQYLNYISLEEDMFLLRNQKRDEISYYSMNKAAVKDTEMHSIIDTIVDSLFCVFVTLGAIPIIRCPRGNAAEMVAEKLHKKLSENLRDARNSFFNVTPSAGSGSFSFSRPLLVILDRSVDLATPLHHTWTYQALIHDVLNLHLNSVTVNDSPQGSDEISGTRPKRSKAQTFNLAQSDQFWHKHKGLPFPEVAEAVQSEIEEYKNHEESVQKLKTAMGLGGAEDGPVDISDNTAKLTSAVNNLPELMEKKRLIDMHTTIATSVLDQIKARKLDEYFELEERILHRSNIDKSLVDFFSDPEAGSPDDKLRLFLIYYISQSQAGQPMSDQELEQYSEALTNAGCKMDALKYIKRWRQYSMVSQASSSTVQHRGGGPKTIGMFSHLMSTGSQFVMEGVKNFAVKKHNLPVTRILDSLMEIKTTPDIEDYRYLDPKVARSLDSSARTKTPYNEAIVFVVGGGNYIEYQNIMEYVKGKTNKSVSYGSSEILNAMQFVTQLNRLGEEV